MNQATHPPSGSPDPASAGSAAGSYLGQFGEQSTHRSVLSLLENSSLPENKILEMLVQLPALEEEKCTRLEGLLQQDQDRPSPVADRWPFLLEVAADHLEHGDGLDSENWPTPSALVRYADRRVVGQKEAKQQLASALYVHARGLRAPEGSELARSCREMAGPLFFFGPTGSGKTLLHSVMVGEAMGLPYLTIDASALVPEGIVGPSLGSVVLNLLRENGNDPAALRGCCVFLDEADKLWVTPSKGSDAVASQLLGLLEGKPVRLCSGNRDFMPATEELEIDTWFFSLAGAWQGLHEKLGEGPPAELGFGSPSNGLVVLEKTTLSDEDILEHGVPRELLGRILALAPLRELAKGDLLEILRLGGNHSPLGRMQSALAGLGQSLELGEADLEEIAEKAMDLGMGARGLKRLIREKAHDLFFPADAA